MKKCFVDVYLALPRPRPPREPVVLPSVVPPDPKSENITKLIQLTVRQ